MNDQEMWGFIKRDRAVRRQISSRDFGWFFHLLFPSYIKYETALFQREMMAIAQDLSIKLGVITSFRGSSKSTIFSLAFPLWAIFGILHLKYIVIVCQNQARAQQTLLNIRRELEENTSLIENLGPFIENSNIWNNDTIEILRFGARISVFSINESIRGIRFRENRPQLIICDDLEDVQSAKSIEGRDVLWQLINSEILPAGDCDTRYFFIGNLVHEDSAMMRFKKQMLEGKIDGIYREYPLVNQDGKILWPGKFHNNEDVEKLKRTIGSEIDFLREYMLKIVPTTDQVIPPEWIRYYSTRDLPPDDGLEHILVSIDPAISTNDAACNTGIVILRVYKLEEDLKIYVDPYVINKRMHLDEAVLELKNIQKMFANYTINFIVEGVGMQMGYAEALQREGIPAEIVKIEGQDKHARLMNVSMLIKNNLFFSDHGNNEIVNQVIYFDASKYLDLVDALTLGLKKIAMDDFVEEPKLYIAELIPGGAYRILS